MTNEENIYALYEKVADKVTGWHSYHTHYVVGSGECNENKTVIYFTVYGSNDQGDGYEWREEWSIDDEGKIYTDDGMYDSFEDFEKEWC